MSVHTITQEQREEVWRRHGWRPDLSETERQQIEDHWTDQDIEMAQELGFE